MSTEHYHEHLEAHSRSEHQATQLTKGGLSEVFGEDFTEEKLRH
jgi:hypothetical protein